MTEQDLQSQSEQLIEEARLEIEAIKAALQDSRRRSELPDHSEPEEADSKALTRTN
jgi:hypothetical protein